MVLFTGFTKNYLHECNMARPKVEDVNSPFVAIIDGTPEKIFCEDLERDFDTFNDFPVMRFMQPEHWKTLPSEIERLYIWLPTGTLNRFNNLLICDILEFIHLGGGTTKLTSYCFANLQNVKRIHLTAPLKKISVGYFQMCPKLEEVVLPQTLTYMVSEVFHLCDSLKALTIPF